NFYGQTELAPVATILGPDDQLERAGSAGRPVLNVETTLLGDDDKPVPPGVIGEIAHRSPQIVLGYWHDEQRTEAAFRGGWFHSGDLVRMDDEGYVWVVDRKKDMIISGGENIYCAEVENVLASHPAIVEVAVIGRPHEKWGEVPLAVAAVTEPGLRIEELDDFLGERLARYKHPKGLEIVDALPRNPAGKVLKTELRARFGVSAVPQTGSTSTDPAPGG
ncbi:MAG: fatty-acyl-CoA synthase, partial [Mycobacterium sp.]|nr:fatty-acyl-CoA synthase [Mycobacterium sp.]